MFLKKKGFTLIELLIVIAIISILAAMVVVNVSAARIRARDTQRKADLKTVQNALEIAYYKNQKYPGLVNTVFMSMFDFFCPAGLDNPTWNCALSDERGLRDALVNSGLLQKLPSDPKNKNGGLNCLGKTDAIDTRSYYYYNFGEYYVLGTNLEQGTDFTKSCGNYYLTGGKVPEEFNSGSCPCPVT